MDTAGYVLSGKIIPAELLPLTVNTVNTTFLIYHFCVVGSVALNVMLRAIVFLFT